jgi:hypothetical protein
VFKFCLSRSTDVLLVQGDQKVSVHLTITVQNNPHTTDESKMAVTEYIRNVDHAILNTVFENTVRRVNKCLETGGGTLNISCNFPYCNHQVNRGFLITLYLINSEKTENKLKPATG